MIEKLPKIGLGTYLMKDKELLKSSIKTALEAGYEHIDTAQAYGNEKFIGEILAELEIPRNKFFITSKVHPFNYKYHTRSSVSKTLEDLKLEMIDLVLLHVGVEDETNILAFKELMKLREEGKIRFIGVSNMTAERIEILKKATGEYPYCNQISLSPLQRAIGLEEYCKSKGIILTGYSILIPYFEQDEVSGNFAFKEEQRVTLMKIAESHKKDVGQILNRWAIHEGYNVIPKSKTPSRVKTNNKLLDFELTTKELEIINSWNLIDEAEYTEKKNGWINKIGEEKYKKGF